MSFLIIAVFLLTAAAAVPIAHGLLMAALAAAATSHKIPMDILVQTMVQQVQSFPLIAIPFFMLTGSLMMGGKLGEALIGVLTRLIGRFHGGPAQVGVLSSTIFGGVSGSAVADASAIGSQASCTSVGISNGLCCQLNNSRAACASSSNKRALCPPR